MLQNWKIFEREATEYLNKNVKISDVVFESWGESDSWKPDILIKRKNMQIGAIEAKLVPSQAGQFVALNDGSRFIYSDCKESEPNAYAQGIMDHINERYEKFSAHGTRGVKVELPQVILIGWIKNHYKALGESHIIFSRHNRNFEENYIKVIPIDDMDEYFTASCVLRTKKSGSSKLSEKYYARADEILQERFPDNYRRQDAEVVFIDQTVPNDLRLPERMYLSPKADNKYQLRRRSDELSGKVNPTVIFSLNYTGDEITSGFPELESYIRALR